MIELAQVHHQIANHRHARQRADLNRFLQSRQGRDAGQAVSAVDIEPVGAADTLSAGMAEAQGFILLFDLEQGIEQHHTRRHVGQLECLHTGFVV